MLFLAKRILSVMNQKTKVFAEEAPHAKKHGIIEAKKLTPEGTERVSNSKYFTDEDWEGPFLTVGRGQEGTQGSSPWEVTP